MTKRKQKAKDLEDARKKIQQLQAKTKKLSSTHVYLKEIQITIYGEVQALGGAMINLYEEVVTMHKVVVPLHDM